MQLQMKRISKSFGANRVLEGVDFEVSPGEIRALLGENGAGKSTLMNILGGVLTADSGEIRLDGRGVCFRSPRESLDAGVAFIHQELNLIDDLRVYQNLFIGRELKRRFGFLDADAMCEKSAQVFRRMGIELDPRALVRDLDASYKQIVEIARALLTNARLIIMDEPTSSLTELEIERVFDMMRMLKDQGVGIVFISHKLKEVIRICDSYSVLRDGRQVACGRVSEVSTLDLARHMVGHDVRSENLQRERRLGEEMLRADALSLPGAFYDVSFSIRAGEIVGFTGLLGDGRSELFQAVFGVTPGFTGQLRVCGRPAHARGTAEAKALGLGYVPRNRKQNGIIEDMNILENGSIVTLSELVRGGLIDRARQRRQFRAQVDALRIKMGDESDLIGSLSGGNQQKVVLAKWLSASPRVLIFDNPTQGVDVGAKEEIYDIILALADRGVAVVVLSSEAQEVIRVCDRALVMFHGRVAGELSGSDMSEQRIMMLATGSN